METREGQDTIPASSATLPPDHSYGFTVEVPGADGRRRQTPASRVHLDPSSRGGTRQVAPTGVRRGHVVVSEQATTASLPAEHLAADAPRRPTTLDAYDATPGSHRPGTRADPSAAVGPATVAAWVPSCQRRGLAPKTVRNIVGVLTAAFDNAVELGLISSNAA